MVVGYLLAKEESRFLVNHGYGKGSAVRFVGDHHGLDSRQRNRLLREVFSDEQANETRKKTKPLDSIRGNALAIDGFNVLITAETVMFGGDSFVCDDGLVRDNTMAFSNYKVTDKTLKAADAVISLLASARPKTVSWVFDSQISSSGRLAAYVERAMGERGINGNSATYRAADHTLAALGTTVATSDSALIMRVGSVVDLPSGVLKLWRKK
jgi:hypothetical protein